MVQYKGTVDEERRIVSALLKVKLMAHWLGAQIAKHVRLPFLQKLHDEYVLDSGNNTTGAFALASSSFTRFSISAKHTKHKKHKHDNGRNSINDNIVMTIQ